MSTTLDQARRSLDRLGDDDLLLFHREVCRRASAVYRVMYGPTQRHFFERAMAVRDTRFQKGLSPVENFMRCVRPFAKPGEP